jgi:prepilin peptidase CpaA
MSMETHANSAFIAHLWIPSFAELRVPVLVLLLLAAAAIDLRSMRIPNWLTMSGAALGLVLAAAVPWQALGPVWAVDGVLWSLAGLAVALLVLLPFYAFGLMGAGDVKLMAMVGSFLGFPQVLPAILAAFIAGGAVAIVFALRHRALWRAFSNVGAMTQSMAFAALAGFRPVAGGTARPSIGKMPYGVSICAGTLAWLVIRHMGHL